MLLDLYFLVADNEWPAPTAGIVETDLKGVVFGKRDFDKRIEKLPKAVKKAIKTAIKKDSRADREEYLCKELARLNADIEASYFELMEIERDRRIEGMIRDELRRIECIEDENEVLAIMLLMG